VFRKVVQIQALLHAFARFELISDYRYLWLTLLPLLGISVGSFFIVTDQSAISLALNLTIGSAFAIISAILIPFGATKLYLQLKYARETEQYAKTPAGTEHVHKRIWALSNDILLLHMVLNGLLFALSVLFLGNSAIERNAKINIYSAMILGMVLGYAAYLNSKNSKSGKR